MIINEVLRGSVLVISPAGRLDSNTAVTLEAVLPTRVQSTATTILDLAGVAYVSSAGLRVLLKGAKMAKASGHTLILSGLSPSVQEVFDISGFSTIFQIEPDIEVAVTRAG